MRSLGGVDLASYSNQLICFKEMIFAVATLEKIRRFLVQEISRTLTELFIYPLNLIYKGNLNYPYVFPTLG